ncbi:Transport and Golgi organisation 2 [Tenacibaculum sp. MAR_2009_124]|uniref:NRDE family protein n=1 Tax=Tenacibaculum sp. MAR_2009_124 TaxID=1250059 RepID=UPI00089AC106|nr:NRDE family protein [Tenacibaculum sp. MAR_2009_124]SEB98211.1 Transport and Golgi organisation 2 [Tenacibaculum sp. MAR_2009_124]
MCTVTFLPLGGNNFILTSNRDENPERETVPPKDYLENGVELTYPKDKIAGGTWIGLSEKNRLICLLNGGFKKHRRAKSYKMSRGVIVKHLLASENAISEVNKFSFDGVEPFTIVLVEWSSALEIYELVWDGGKKYFEKIDNKPHIWSSSTLYDEVMKGQRKEWFTEWLNENKAFEKENIIAFHQDDSKGTPEIAVKMKRDLVETVSTTCVLKSDAKISFEYISEISSELLEKELQL